MITRRARNWLKWAATIALTVLVLGLAAATWYFSGLIDDGLLQSEAWVPDRNVEVSAIGPTWVSVSVTEDSIAPGVWGIEWEGGYAEVGPILALTAETVDRELIAVDGNLVPGTMVAWDPFAFRTDPADRGVGYTTVDVAGPLGDYPAWYVPGDDDTWVVFVHGKGASPREALRLLSSVSRAGYPTLVITYRNDEGAPATSDGRYTLGNDEWEDLEAAVEYALASGARDVVLVGYSMGGSITSTFMRESRWAPRVVGMVMDAPLLNAGAAVDNDAESQGIPGFLTGWAKAITALRWGIDWGYLDHLGHTEELEGLPMLIFHGTADSTVPIWTSDAFAEALPDDVEYIRVDGVEHVRAWNHDPGAYEQAVADFLDDIAAGTSAIEFETGGTDSESGGS
ncbi:alpha/beta hydrolase [bacterium]|nr:alpha/beta hydrolase [bacterium]